MYELFKIRLINCAILGCTRYEWHRLHLDSKNSLTPREYSNLKRIKEYKYISNILGVW